VLRRIGTYSINALLSGGGLSLLAATGWLGALRRLRLLSRLVLGLATLAGQKVGDTLAELGPCFDTRKGS
jgi:hypothetical protein